MFKSEIDDEIAEQRQHRYQDLVEHYSRHPSTTGAELDYRGHEQPDPHPMAPPGGYVPSPDLFEIIRSMVRRASDELADEGSDNDTFDEADDFDTGEPDDYDPRSGYEVDIDGPPDPEVPKAPGVKEGTEESSSARSAPGQAASEAPPEG